MALQKSFSIDNKSANTASNPISTKLPKSWINLTDEEEESGDTNGEDQRNRFKMEEVKPLDYFLEALKKRRQKLESLQDDADNPGDSIMEIIRDTPIEKIEK